MWPEVEVAKSENRRELVLGGEEIKKRIDKDGLDVNIFKLTNLNFLNVHDTNIADVSSDIGKLANLQTLSLHSNKLGVICDQIGLLEKLKVLDLSRNVLEKVPNVFDALPNLMSINLSSNKLSEFPALSKNTKLSVLDISNNKLEEFPDVCHENMVCLAEIKINGNQITSIPGEISALGSLKNFDISSNKVKIVPGELVDCHKLKELNLKENPITDRRLFKLIDQCRTKQILDYVKQHCARGPPKTSGGENTKKNPDSNKNVGEAPKNYKYSIKITYAKDEFNVVSMINEVKKVREHILSCIVHNVEFTEDTFKKFIQIQNKLHEGVCEKRNAATIATHDYNKLPPGNLKYTTLEPEALKMKPLNREKLMTGAHLFKKLQIEAQNLRKEKKRNTYSGIHKYLYLIEGHPQYPCLLNSEGAVISFPPITNSDISKIELTTKAIFIEVTSSTSQLSCRKVLDTLLKEMVLLFEKNLDIQQVKIVDIEGNLKATYPSKTDLIFDDLIQVLRD